MGIWKVQDFGNSELSPMFVADVLDLFSVYTNLDCCDIWDLTLVLMFY